MEVKFSSKQHAPLVIAGLLIGTSTAALADPSTSALDPYPFFQAPKNTPGYAPSGKGKAAPRAAEGASAQQEQEPSTTYVTFTPDGDKSAQKGDKAAKGAKPAADGASTGLLSNVNDKFKSAGSGLVSGTKGAGAKMVESSKAVGEGMASGTKKMREGIASGAKASGDFFMKGARAIGHGFKATGEKMKEGTEAVGGKVASLPKLGGKKDEKAPAAAPAQHESAEVASKPVRTQAAQAQPKVAKSAAKPGFMSKFGKLKIWGKDSNGEPLPNADDENQRISSPDPLKDIPR